MWEKQRTAEPALGTILFVHGSSMAATPGFDLQAPGTDYVSAMDWFASKGFDTWTVDHRGYGRSYKGPEMLATIAEGADDLAAASDYIMTKNKTGPLNVYGISSGALRAALFAERHPDRVKRLALDSYVWTGKGSPTLAERARAGPSAANSSTASTPATRFTQPIRPSSNPIRKPCSLSTTQCPMAPISTCARICR
jgi:pimeloyl-ACP methyl ester carboxylesterase